MKSRVGEMLSPSESGHSLFGSLAVGRVFQIKGEVNDSHLKGKEKLITVYLCLLFLMDKNEAWLLGSVGPRNLPALT